MKCATFVQGKKGYNKLYVSDYMCKNKYRKTKLETYETDYLKGCDWDEKTMRMAMS